MAKLSKEDFKDIANKFPVYLQTLKDQLYLYDDPIKLFLEEQLRKIPYL